MTPLLKNAGVDSFCSRIGRRNYIEFLCYYAIRVLPVHESMLFNLYFRDGHTLVDISQLLMVRSETVSRRIKKITDKLIKTALNEA